MYLQEDKPERKPVAKGDQFQVELDEVDEETAAVAEVLVSVCVFGHHSHKQSNALPSVRSGVWEHRA